MHLDSGRDADVYAFGDSLVLRTYRDGGDVRGEAAIMHHVRAHGYPVPAVHGAGGRDMWLDRLHGPTMLTAVTEKSLAVDAAGAILAGLHHRLHRVPGDIVHLDLHPANVMLTADGPVVIDWRNARTGPAGLDVALTALILAQVALDPGRPANFREVFSALLRPFLRAAGEPVELDGAVAYRRADPNMTPAELGLIATAARLVEESAP